ncbi:MAG: hypothetical protein ABR572_10185 [Cryomorphaceae bacterium]|nr:hypothetical protein [Flavobacteriales bacterium]
MISTEEQIQIHGDPSSGKIDIKYAPKTKRTLFDICDINGRILKTGAISGAVTSVKLDDIALEDQYIILILDGDRVCSRKFKR